MSEDGLFLLPGMVVLYSLILDIGGSGAVAKAVGGVGFVLLCYVVIAHPDLPIE